MLGNLVASCLLAGAVAVNVPKAPLTTDEAITLDMPKKAPNQPSIYGAYVLDHFDKYESFFTEQLFEDDISLTITNTNVICNVYGLYQGTYNSTYVYDYQYLPLESLVLFYDSLSNSITATMYFNSDVNSDVYSLVVGVFDNYQDVLFERLNTSSGLLDINYFSFNIANQITLTNDQLALFNTIFTNRLNTHFVMYSGWYHLYDSFNLPNYWFWITIVGNLMTENFYYNNVVFSMNRSATSVITATYFPSNSDFQPYFKYLYSDGWRMNDRNILMTNVVISDVAVQRLELIGVFNFLPVSTNYTLTDLFIDIADTPIVFLTSMFNFELFGTTFYIAFLGIVTVIAIIFVLRKVL